MTATRFMTQPCTIHHAAAATGDEYGDPTATITDAPATCLVQQKGTIESTAGGEVITTDAIGYFPPGTILGRTDSVTVGDHTYQVEGDAEDVWNPRTRTVSHVRARLRFT